MGGGTGDVTGVSLINPVTLERVPIMATYEVQVGWGECSVRVEAHTAKDAVIEVRGMGGPMSALNLDHQADPRKDWNSPHWDGNTGPTSSTVELHGWNSKDYNLDTGELKLRVALVEPQRDEVTGRVLGVVPLVRKGEAIPYGFEGGVGRFKRTSSGPDPYIE